MTLPSGTVGFTGSTSSSSGHDVCVNIDTETDIVRARKEGRSLAAGLDFQTTDLAIIATAISELARNVIAYAGRGEIHFRTIAQNGTPGLVVVASDDGPGISDVAHAVQDGYSTSGGLGIGLPGVRRLMDQFDIESSPGSGTKVTITKWRR
jgi:serine/threonine-protein kinase RsbT